MTSLAQSIELCRTITAKHAKTFYLGSQLMPLQKRHAIWAIYAWLRNTDELVDGAEAGTTTPETLDLWEENMEALFADKTLSNPTDVALVDAIERYSIPVEPFREMIAGQRMDLDRDRYETWEELRLYCYRVAGTVGEMSSAIMGFAPGQYALEEAISLGLAMQLTNILRDVGEDARRSRIYLPAEDLKKFNYSEQDLFNCVVDRRWIALMDFEIKRARDLYAKAESGISSLNKDARWPVWASLMLYRQILNAIERNQYQVFRRRAYVSKLRKAVALPVAWWRAQYRY